MRRFLAVSFIMALGIACLLAAQLRGQQSDEALRSLIPQIVASWETFDLSKIEPYYASDADFTYFDIAPLKYNNWAEYRAGSQKGFERTSSLNVKLNDDLRIHSRGNLAWATFTFGADITNKEGAASHLDGRWTMVLEKRAKGWTVVHEHVSVPLGGSS